MQKALKEDKQLIVDLLTQSFDGNKSVNYLLKQDYKRKLRLEVLMDYSFEICSRFGEVYLSEDRKACALVLYPDQKKNTFRTVMLDLKLLLKGIGLRNVRKAINREEKLKKEYPQEPVYYLWFIGVSVQDQGKGIGSRLLQQLIQDSENQGRTICLETSTFENVPFYQKFNLSIYRELDFGYPLFMMKR